MDLIYILVSATILYVSWRFGQAWIGKREFVKRRALRGGNQHKAVKK